MEEFFYIKVENKKHFLEIQKAAYKKGYRFDDRYIHQNKPHLKYEENVIISPIYTKGRGKSYVILRTDYENFDAILFSLHPEEGTYMAGWDLNNLLNAGYSDLVEEDINYLKGIKSYMSEYE